MSNCGSKAQHRLSLQHDTFVRLNDDLNYRHSSPAAAITPQKCGFNTDDLGRGRRTFNALNSTSRYLGFRISIDPQVKLFTPLNMLLVMSIILGISTDVLFLYLPVFNESLFCQYIDENFAITATILRTAVDAFYLIHLVLQFRVAYIAPPSRVFGQGKFVIDPAKITKRYLNFYLIIGFLAVLPLPQIVVLRFLWRSRGSDVLTTKQALLLIVFFQFIPRFARVMPFTSELKRTSGMFAQTAWAGALSSLLLYMFASHIVGAFWYMLAVERNDTCWKIACKKFGASCNNNFLYCGNQYMNGYDTWSSNSSLVLSNACNPSTFDFGIFGQALSSHVVSTSNDVLSKYFYCLWWGLQQLSSRGNGLQPSTYPVDIMFCIALKMLGIILLALFITNMQLQRHINWFRGAR